MEYVVTGSTAAIFYGEPRLPHDIDLVTSLSPDDVSPFIDTFDLDNYHSPGLAKGGVAIYGQVVMDFLVVSPPVCTPAEPPSGAFTLAAGLCGRGYEAGLLDLSALFFRHLFSQRLSSRSPQRRSDPVEAALRYLVESREGFDPLSHRSALGVLHNHLKGMGQKHPGWRFTLMDVTPPQRIHDPLALWEALGRERSPFEGLFQGPLTRALTRHRPNQVLVSLAYLSQLPGTLALVRFLKAQGYDPVVGGSLLNSLELTGHGLDLLGKVLPHIVTGDGLSLVRDRRPSSAKGGGERLVDRLLFPQMVSCDEGWGEAPRGPGGSPGESAGSTDAGTYSTDDEPLSSAELYLSPHPVIPLPLSTGCFWRQCLFCPDGQMPFHAVPTKALEAFVRSVPESWKDRRPVFHLIDSALPPKKLRAFLPLARELGAGFYGFARPSEELLKDDLLGGAAESGCLMLQLGVESGSRRLLDTYKKGIDPAVSARVLSEAAAAGIRTYAYLLMGLPGETEEHRRATLKLLERHGEEVDFLNLSLFNLPRSCSLVEHREAFGIEIEEFPGDDGALRLYYPFTVENGSPRREARRFLKETFWPHPTVHAIQLRTPRWLRAAHLAMMRLPNRRPL